MLFYALPPPRAGKSKNSRNFKTRTRGYKTKKTGKANSHSKSGKVPTYLISSVCHAQCVLKGQLTLIFLSTGLCLCASSLFFFPSNLDYFFLCWTQLYRIMAKGRKDFLARAKEKGVGVDTGIVTRKLSEKRLGARTRRNIRIGWINGIAEFW